MLGVESSVQLGACDNDIITKMINCKAYNYIRTRRNAQQETQLPVGDAEGAGGGCGRAVTPPGCCK